MIQRIQTLYLLVATFLSGGLIFLIDLWNDSNGQEVFATDLIFMDSIGFKVITILFFVSAFITFITIFLYKKRQLQFVLGRLSIISNFILLGILIYYSQNFSTEIEVYNKGFGLFIPILTIVFVVLANKAIKKDEDLVKSVDRLR